MLTAKYLSRSGLPGNLYFLKGPTTFSGTKQAASSGGLSSVNCDKKGGTIINDHFYDNNTNSRALIG